MDLNALLAKYAEAHKTGEIAGRPYTHHDHSWTRPVKEILNDEAFNKLDHPFRSQIVIDACLRLGRLRIPQDAQSFAMEWIAKHVEETRAIWPANGTEDLLHAQREVQEVFRLATWRRGEDGKQQRVGITSSAWSSSEIEISAQPIIGKDSAGVVATYACHINAIIDFDAFNRFDLYEPFGLAFQACKALARMEVPDDVVRKVKSLVRMLVLNTAQEHGLGLLLERQMLIQQWLWLALWKCGCETEEIVEECKFVKAKRDLGQTVCIVVGDQSPRVHFVEAEDDAIAELIRPPVLERKSEDRKQDKIKEPTPPPGTIDPNVSDVFNIHKPDSFRLEPGATGTGAISSNLRQFCGEWNTRFAEDPWLATRVYAACKGWTSGERGRVLRVYSSKLPNMRAVKAFIGEVLRVREEGGCSEEEQGDDGEVRDFDSESDVEEDSGEPDEMDDGQD